MLNRPRSPDVRPRRQPAQHGLRELPQQALEHARGGNEVTYDLDRIVEPTGVANG